MRRLYTFAVSHFSEKARWALDHAKISYEEKKLLPGPHLPVVRRLAPKSCVPVWVEDGRVLQGASAIVDRIEELAAIDLTPSEEARRLEGEADLAFGLGIQRIFYDELLEQPSEVIDLWAQHGPWWGRGFYRLTYPVIKKKVRELYGITDASVAEAKKLFAATMDDLDGRLEKSDYLCGNGFSRADLAVAALLAPMVCPPEHLMRWPERHIEPLLDFSKPFEDGPTWRHVRRMYRQHRLPT